MVEYVRWRMTPTASLAMSDHKVAQSLTESIKKLCTVHLFKIKKQDLINQSKNLVEKFVRYLSRLIVSVFAYSPRRCEGCIGINYFNGLAALFDTNQCWHGMEVFIVCGIFCDAVSHYREKRIHGNSMQTSYMPSSNLKKMDYKKTFVRPYI